MTHAMRGTSRAPPPLLLVLLVLCGLAVSFGRVQAATTTLFQASALTIVAGRLPSCQPAAEPFRFGVRQPKGKIASVAADAVADFYRGRASHAAATDGPTTRQPPAGDKAETDAVALPTPTIDEDDEHRPKRPGSSGSGSGSGNNSGSNSGSEGGGGGGDDDDDGRGESPRPSDNQHVGGAAAAGAVDAASSHANGSPGADGSAAQEGSAAGLIPLARRPVSLAERAKEKIGKTWTTVEVGIERVIHVRREVKAVFSSELERCLLKATRPENIAVDEACMQALVAQANRLSAVEACCDCDPHEVVCSKVLKKMMEQDWRTVAKALYVLHRLQRDSPPKEANRFSAFIRDQWAEGAGGLGKHMRVDGGMNAPWLKVYCGYLAARGLHLETATNAFRSWETLTSTRQLRNALTETNALLAAALALHFADDASSGGGGGEAVRRACCALAFQDVADVRAMLRGTGQPPALLDVLGVGDESGGRQHSQPRQRYPAASEQEGGRAQVTPSGCRRRQQHESAGVAESADAAAAHDGDKDGAEAAEEAKDEGTHSKEGEEEEEEEEDGEEQAAAVLRDIKEDVLKAAKECAVYEDVSGLMTAVYSARYGEEVVGSAVPLWIRQMAALGRLAGRINVPDSSSRSSSSGSGNGAQRNERLRPAAVTGEGAGEAGATEAAAAGVGADGAGGGRAEEGAHRESNSRFGDDELRGGGSRPTSGSSSSSSNSNTVGGGLAEGKRGRPMSMADIVGMPTTRDGLKLRGGGGGFGVGVGIRGGGRSASPRDKSTGVSSRSGRGEKGPLEHAGRTA